MVVASECLLTPAGREPEVHAVMNERHDQANPAARGNIDDTKICP
jgi:hypothetical protein